MCMEFLHVERNVQFELGRCHLRCMLNSMTVWECGNMDIYQ